MKGKKVSNVQQGVSISSLNAAHNACVLPVIGNLPQILRINQFVQKFIVRLVVDHVQIITKIERENLLELTPTLNASPSTNKAKSNFHIMAHD